MRRGAHQKNHIGGRGAARVLTAAGRFNNPLGTLTPFQPNLDKGPQPAPGQALLREPAYLVDSRSAKEFI